MGHVVTMEPVNWNKKKKNTASLFYPTNMINTLYRFTHIKKWSLSPSTWEMFSLPDIVLNLFIKNLMTLCARICSYITAVVSSPHRYGIKQSCTMEISSRDRFTSWIPYNPATCLCLCKRAEIPPQISCSCEHTVTGIPRVAWLSHSASRP